MKFYQVVEFDRLYNISKFHQIPFGGGLSLWIKNPGMETVGMTPLPRIIWHRATDIPGNRIES